MAERLRLSVVFNHPPYPNRSSFNPTCVESQKTTSELIKEVLANRDRNIALGIEPKKEIEIIGSSEYKFKYLSPCYFHPDFILMLDFQEPSLQKIALDEIKNFAGFPQSGGIYFCVRDQEVWYIGKASNFRSRWQNHHKLEALKTITNVVVYFLPIYGFSNEEIHKAEQEYIEMLQPVFNNTSNPEKYLTVAS